MVIEIHRYGYSVKSAYYRHHYFLVVQWLAVNQMCAITP
jgi:hypothetical protein